MRSLAQIMYSTSYTTEDLFLNITVLYTITIDYKQVKGVCTFSRI